MPPVLHPRSRTTTSLFTTTLAISFLVVAAPHLLPCPAHTTMYADGEVPASIQHQQRRRRRKQLENNMTSIEDQNELGRTGVAMGKESDDTSTARTRECPVPKPGGLVGKILGVESKGEGDPVSVRVETTKAMKRRENNQ